MSKPIDRKNNAPASNASDAPASVVRTTFSYVPPLETSGSNEAVVAVTVKEIRFGGKTVASAEVVALNNGIKRNWDVPMNEPLRQEFPKITDDMVFKLAVTANHDLVGFLYIEIPKKLRSMKTIKMEDWFPVKRLETEDKEKELSQNYRAKILIEYEASKRLEPGKPALNRAPRAELFQELTTNLKDRLDQLHKRVDDYGSEGFKFLDEYQQKMASAKGSTGKPVEAKKVIRVNAVPNRLVEAQKDTFYRTRAVGDPEDKSLAYASAPLTDKTVHMTKNAKKDDDDLCQRCEKLYKELTYSNQELIQTNSRVSALERERMTPENLSLKREVETLQQQLAKDRRDLNIKLKEANNNLQTETLKLSKQYEEENEAAKALQAEARALQQELADRLKAVEGQEKDVTKRREAMGKREAKANERQRKIAEDFNLIQREHQEIAEEMSDMEELKSRMMIERERVFGEQSRLQTTKSGTQEKTGQMQTVEEFLEEEKEQYKKELAKRNMELDQLRADVEKQKRLHELEVQNLAENKIEYERKQREHSEAQANHRIEVARLAREKNNLASSMADFLDQKKGFEQEKEVAEDEIAHNYDLIDEQSQNLAQQRAEYNHLLKRLEDFETTLADQAKMHQEQKSKFGTIQKTFYKRLQDPSSDLKEIKKLAEEAGVSLNDADERFQEAQRLERDMSRIRADSKKSIERLSAPTSQADLKMEKRSVGDKKLGVKMRETASLIGGGQIENKMKLQQNAAALVEKIFSDASLAVHKTHNLNKQEIIESLRFKIEILQEEIRKLVEKAQGAKINFLSDNADEDALIRALNPQRDAEPDSPRSPDTFLKHRPAEEPVEPEELLETMGDLCEATLQQIEQDLHVGVSIPNCQEKIDYLNTSNRVLQEQFKVLRQLAVAAGKERPKDGEAFNWASGQLDHEAIRSQFDAKMKVLLDYIHQLKINNDFFNPAIDTAILSS